MFEHRHGPRTLSTCNLLGVTFLLLIVAGSYHVSADLSSEFVKGKSEFLHTLGKTSLNSAAILEFLYFDRIDREEDHSTLTSEKNCEGNIF